MSRFQVVPDELNVRSGPGPGYDILDTLLKGAVIEEMPADPGWAMIPMDDGSVAWVNRKFLTVAPQPLPGAPTSLPVSPAGGEPKWITWSRSKVGEHEGINPEIDSWFKLTTLPKSMWDSTQTPWCAVFVNAGFCLNGVEGLHDALAVDWLNFGIKVTDPRVGDVVVFKWASGGHHVAYVLTVDEAAGTVKVIGGNQSDAVTIATYSTDYVMGYRRAA